MLASVPEGPTVAAPDDPPDGRNVLFADRYRILGELGRGGMGVVYRASDVRLKRPVALKFLSADLSAQPDARARFLREAQAAARIDNPHVCTVYEAGECGPRAYIAMAFIEGGSLKDRLAQGPLPLQDIVTFSCQIADGLAAAHGKEVVHRDIKPANIMLAGGRTARITDFGLARVAETAESTRTAGVAGTMAYMSPEQAQGLRTDSRTDVWSLGCVMYEMLSGRAPFSTPDGRADLLAILHGDTRPLGAVRPDAPARLVAVVSRCLEKDAERRYADAAGVLADLQSIRLDASAVPGTEDAIHAVPSVAVLPFVDMSPEQNQEYFGEGIAEELIHALSRIHGLRVVARTSAFALGGRGLDVREIGRTLNVGAVLEGSVRASGNRLRITAQLIDVASGFHLWSERFDRDAGDIFAIQDELSLSIVDHLKVSLHVADRDALQKRSTADHEAYNLYLKGLYLLARPRPDTLQTALRFFQESLAHDPGFAKAHTGIASVHGMLGNLNFAPPNEAWPKAKAEVARALALDDRLPEAHELRASAAFWYDWDWTEAAASFERTLSLNPGSAVVHGNYAWFLLNRGRFDECLEQVAEAISLDPLMPVYYGWSVALHCATGRLDGALREFARAMEIDPAFGLPYFHAGMAYTRKGDLDKAIETLAAGSRIAVHPGWAEGVLVYIHLAQGNRAAAEHQLARMIDDKSRTNVSSVTIAWSAANLGDLDSATRWLDRAIGERDTLVVLLHVYTPWIAPALFEDSRFRARLTTLGLADIVVPAG